MALEDITAQLRDPQAGIAGPTQNITTPLGFFDSTIAPVFNEDVFSAENLAGEMDRPEMSNIFNVRQNISDAANDEDLSLLQFDASANLARQKIESDLVSRDTYTRGKRDLEFNINSERDVQFQQGSQLLRDIDAFIGAQRATVQQREYEKEIKRQEEMLKQQKKEELQMMAMQMGIDPGSKSRKELIKSISSAVGARSSASSGGRSGGSTGGRTASNVVADSLQQASARVYDIAMGWASEMKDEYGNNPTFETVLEDLKARGIYDGQLDNDSVYQFVNDLTASGLSETEAIDILEKEGYVSKGEYK